MLLAVLYCLPGCTDFDSWSTDSSVRLSFGSDTVNFDTLLSTVPSSTQRLLVYNKQKADIRIRQVSLKHGAKSLFRVNVDGEFLQGGSGGWFDVKASDSIFVLVETTLPDANTDLVTTYTDSLCFSLASGAIQYVPIVAGGQDALHWHGVKTISSNTTLSSRRPIVIYDSLYVAKDVTLTLQGGTHLYFHQKASMQVDGTLIVQGTLEQPVVLRGDRTGYLFDYLPYDNTPNQWGGVYLRGSGHRFSYLDLHSSSTGLWAEDTDLELANCIINNSGGNALTLRNSRLRAYNTQLSNSANNLCEILGGDTEMTFCTLAQYDTYNATVGWALSLNDFEVENNDTMYYNIEQATFRNCVITGRGEDVISGRFIKEQKFQDSVAYSFQRCYLNTVYSEDDSVRFQCNIYEDSKDSISQGRQFLIFDTRARLFDFTPDTLAHFCDSADIQWAELYPQDRLGRSRMQGQGADIGAYENVQRQPQQTSKKARR